MATHIKTQEDTARDLRAQKNIITVLHGQAYKMLRYTQEDIEMVFSVMTDDEKEITKNELHRLLYAKNSPEDAIRKTFHTQAVILDIACRQNHVTN